MLMMLDHLIPGFHDGASEAVETGLARRLQLAYKMRKKLDVPSGITCDQDEIRDVGGQLTDFETLLLARALEIVNIVRSPCRGYKAFQRVELWRKRNMLDLE